MLLAVLAASMGSVWASKAQMSLRALVTSWLQDDLPESPKEQHLP